MYVGAYLKYVYTIYVGADLNTLYSYKANAHVQ